MSNKKYVNVLEEETFELAKQCAINSVNNNIKLLRDLKDIVQPTSYICFKIDVLNKIKIELEELSYEY